MEITELKITQADFERALPVAQSKNGYIFEACAPFIKSEYVNFRNTVLEEDGVQELQNNETLRDSVISAVCACGFLNVFRQLDVVLTNTGFGVVSTQDTAPASQARVKALEDSIKLLALRDTRNCVYELVRLPEWGETAAAFLCIPNLCWDFEVMLNFAGLEVTYGNWQSAQPIIQGAINDITNNISSELMNTLLIFVRGVAYATPYDIQLISDIKHTVAARMASNEELYQQGLRNIIQYVERNINEFEEYRNSDIYEARHYKGYENTKDSKMFVF